MKLIESSLTEIIHTVQLPVYLTTQGTDLIFDAVTSYVSQAFPREWWKTGAARDALTDWWNWEWSCDQQDPKLTMTTQINGEQRTVPVVYRGNFPNRMARWLRSQFELQVDEAFRTNIGNIYNLHRAQMQQAYLRLTKDVEWKAGVFGDEGSCYWSYNSAARWLVQSQGYALQRFDSPEFDLNDEREFRAHALARCWVLPYYHRQTEFYLVYNAYGRCDRLGNSEVYGGSLLPNMTNALATLLEGKVSKVWFTNNGDDSGTLYINGGTAHVIGPDKDALARLGDSINVHYDMEDWRQRSCMQCGRTERANEEFTEYDEDDECYVCPECLEKHFTRCEKCDTIWRNGDVLHYPDGSGNFCESCASRLKSYCSGCHTLYAAGTELRRVSGLGICPNCESHIIECPECHKEMLPWEGYDFANNRYCYSCYNTVYYRIRRRW